DENEATAVLPVLPMDSGVDVPAAAEGGGQPPDRALPPLDEPLPEDRFLNRELSWLDFNARVLTLAEDPGNPLLERAKFLAIFASNLDEFYMVRVAGLKRRMQTGLPIRRPEGLSSRELMELIAERAADLVGRH